jgi:hypothetical protein
LNSQEAAQPEQRAIAERSGPVIVHVENGKPVTPQGEALLAENLRDAENFRDLFKW